MEYEQSSRCPRCGAACGELWGKCHAGIDQQSAPASRRAEIAAALAAALAAVDWTPNDDEIATSEAAKAQAAEVATAILDTGALLGFTLPMPEFSANGIGGVDLEWSDVRGELLVVARGDGGPRYFARCGTQSIKGACVSAGVVMVAAWIAEACPETKKTPPA